MKNALVASRAGQREWRRTAGSGDVSFAFTAVEVEYTPQKEDGSAGGSVKATWDFAANKE